MSLAGLRRNWSDFLDPQLEEIQQDFGGYLRAQNGWLDPLFPELLLLIMLVCQVK